MQWPPGIGIAAVNLGLIGWTSAYGPIENLCKDTASHRSAAGTRRLMHLLDAASQLQQCNHGFMAPKLCKMTTATHVGSLKLTVRFNRALWASCSAAVRPVPSTAQACVVQMHLMQDAGPARIGSVDHLCLPASSLRACGCHFVRPPASASRRWFRRPVVQIWIRQGLSNPPDLSGFGHAPVHRSSTLLLGNMRG